MNSTSLARWKPFAALGLGALVTTLALAGVLAPSGQADRTPFRAAALPTAEQLPNEPTPLAADAAASPDADPRATSEPAPGPLVAPALPRNNVPLVVAPTAVVAPATAPAAVAMPATENTNQDLASSSYSVRRPTRAGHDIADAIQQLSSTITFTSTRDYENLRGDAAALRERY